MITRELLKRQVESVGFRCRSCGSCCRSDAGDNGLVMVSPDEVRAIMAATGLSWEDVAIPYPEMIEDGNGGRFTLGWCVRRTGGGACRFLVQGRCSVYASRPWICRTYPFMLNGDELIVSACEGLGRPVSAQEALGIAHDLLDRKTAEEDEAARIRKILNNNPPPSGSCVVIDSEGGKVIDG